MTEDWVEDIDKSLERFFSVEEVLPLTSKLFTGTNPIEKSISVQFVGNTVGKTNSCELVVVKALKVEGKMNLFAIYPIGATMQDGGKRTRSNVVTSHLWSKFKIKNKKLKNKINKNKK